MVNADLLTNQLNGPHNPLAAHTASLANVNTGLVRDMLACPAVFRVTLTTAALASWTANGNVSLNTFVIYARNWESLTRTICSERGRKLTLNMLPKFQP